MIVYAIIIAVLFFASLVAVLVFLSRRNSENIKAAAAERKQKNGHELKFALLKTATKFVERLFEIKDKGLISRIISDNPGTEKLLADTAGNEEKAFVARIPEFAILTTAAKVTVPAGAAVGVALLLYALYHVSKINSKLGTMSDNINKIIDFQANEFKARIMSLTAHIEGITKFSIEILENDEQRMIKLTSLDSLCKSATELLGQVNETILSIIKSGNKINDKVYQEKVEELAVLDEYQKVLITVLEEIGKLTYLFGKGDSSWEYSYSIYNNFLEKSREVREELIMWHEIQIGDLSICVDNNRIKKDGLPFISAFLNDKYKELESGMVDKIKSQSQNLLEAASEPKNIYGEELKIVIKSGKFFYLNENIA